MVNPVNRASGHHRSCKRYVYATAQRAIAPWPNDGHKRARTWRALWWSLWGWPLYHGPCIRFGRIALWWLWYDQRRPLV